jgi:hypothetical protein
MIWQVKIVDEKQKILIIGKNQTLIYLFKKKLENLGSQIFISPFIPKTMKNFDYYFLINPSNNLKNKYLFNKNVFFIYFNQKPEKNLSAKTIFIKGDQIDDQTIEKILWFCFSNTKEKHLLINLPKSKKKKFKLTPPNFFPHPSRLFYFFNKRNLFIIIFLIILFLNFIFVPPFLISGIFLSQTFNNFKNEDLEKAKNNFFIAKNNFYLSKKLYSFSRPVFLLFSLASYPDDLMEVGEQTISIAEQGFLAYNNAQAIFSSLFKKNKSQEEKQLIILRIKNLSTELKIIEKNVANLTQKIKVIPHLDQKKQLLTTLYEALTKTNKILPYFKKILDTPTERKILVLFNNNMELRPGGGFIGSIGIIRIKNYTIEEIQVYDVYDIDGQLIVHIEPPAPIKKYLNLPSFFLRDSNFSPDNWENYQKAKFFLEKSVSWKDFTGGIVLTTTAIQKILDAFPPIYLPDFKEKITKDNFYLKTQFYVEKDFFPGSIQKKSFLNSLVRNLIINLPQASIKNLSLNLFSLLEEKQMVLSFDDENLQKIIENLGWAGRLAKPVCLFSIDQNCLIDFLFPYEANLGANKANFFINRHFDLKIDIDTSGKITNNFRVLFKNSASSNLFLGETYRNYFQLLIPKNTTLKTVKKDGILIDDINIEEKDDLKNIGFFLEIPAKKTVLVEIVYELNTFLPANLSTLQLIFQKQIGLPITELNLTFNLPKNISILNQNFFPLVKSQKIVYNTFLSTDKIFFIQLKKYD